MKASQAGGTSIFILKLMFKKCPYKYIHTKKEKWEPQTNEHPKIMVAAFIDKCVKIDLIMIFPKNLVNERVIYMYKQNMNKSNLDHRGNFYTRTVKM